MIEKAKSLLKKYYDILAYLVFGVLTTVVNYLVYLPCYNLLGMRAVVSNAIAWFVAVAFAYVTNRIWVFESKRRGFVPIVGEIAAFAGGRVFTLLLQEVLMAIFFTWLGFNEYIVKIVAAVLVVILNYFISKIFVFRKKNG